MFGYTSYNEAMLEVFLIFLMVFLAGLFFLKHILPAKDGMVYVDKYRKIQIRQHPVIYALLVLRSLVLVFFFGVLTYDIVTLGKISGLVYVGLILAVLFTLMLSYIPSLLHVLKELKKGKGRWTRKKVLQSLLVLVAIGVPAYYLIRALYTMLTF